MIDDIKKLTVMLTFEGQDDGRIYVTSPDLKGFHFLLEEGEDPLNEMKNALKTHLEHVLGKKIMSLGPAPRIREFKAREMDVAEHLYLGPGTIMAEMA